MVQRLNLAIGSIRGGVERYRRVLGERNVALLLGAGLASEIGDWLNTVALIAISYRLGDGALGVGGFLAIRMVPRLLFQGPAGALVDRWPGHRLLILSQLMLAVIAGLFALLTTYPSLWLLYLLVFSLETASTLARPAFMVALQTAAPPEWRPAANGLFFAGMTTAQFIGPLLGAVLLVPLGTAAFFLFNAVTFLCVAFAITQLRGHAMSTAEPGSVSGEIAATPAAAPPPVPGGVGYAELLKRGELSLYALISLGLSLLVQATIALFVVRALVLGLGEGGVGIFYAAVGIGSLIGSVVAGAGSHGERRTLFPVAIAMALCAASLALFGAVGSTLLALIALAIAGFTTNFHEVVAISYFQHRLPESLFGRFFSLFLMALSAGALIGALLGPALERQRGVAVTLTGLALPALLLAVVLASVSVRSSSRRGTVTRGAGPFDPGGPPRRPRRSE